MPIMSLRGGRRSSIDGRHPRYDETYPSRWPCPYQRSLDATRPGDTTPRIMHSTGGVSHAGPGDHNSLIRSYEKGNGGVDQGWVPLELRAALVRVQVRLVVSQHEGDLVVVGGSASEVPS
jgi:hypothetical protein